VSVAAVKSRAFAALDTRGFLHYRRGEYDLAVADYDAALVDKTMSPQDTASNLLKSIA